MTRRSSSGNYGVSCSEWAELLRQAIPSEPRVPAPKPASDPAGEAPRRAGRATGLVTLVSCPWHPDPALLVDPRGPCHPFPFSAPARSDRPLAFGRPRIHGCPSSGRRFACSHVAAPRQCCCSRSRPASFPCKSQMGASEAKSSGISPGGSLLARPRSSLERRLMRLASPTSLLCPLGRAVG